MIVNLRGNVAELVPMSDVKFGVSNVTTSTDESSRCTTLSIFMSSNGNRVLHPQTTLTNQNFQGKKGYRLLIN